MREIIIGVNHREGLYLGESKVDWEKFLFGIRIIFIQTVRKGTLASIYRINWL